MIDPIVEETRKAGNRVFARHGNDMHAVVEYLRDKERREGRRVVSFRHKRLIQPRLNKKAG